MFKVSNFHIQLVQNFLKFQIETILCFQFKCGVIFNEQIENYVYMNVAKPLDIETHNFKYSTTKYESAIDSVRMT